MGRPRKFDHDEARRLRAEGLTFTAIGQLLGVSYVAVSRACQDDLRARGDALSLAAHRRKRTPCRGGCGRLVWRTSTKRTGYCRQCLGALRQTAAHGTETRYKRCDCDDCRKAASAARRVRRERQAA